MRSASPASSPPPWWGSLPSHLSPARCVGNLFFLLLVPYTKKNSNNKNCLRRCDRARETPISVSLPLTTPETSSQIRAFRQRAFPFCANMFSTPLCRAPLWLRARSSAAVLLTPRSTMFTGRRGSTSAALAKEKSAPAKWDLLGFDMMMKLF